MRSASPASNLSPKVRRKSRIARFVRQTRTITYDKIAAAKIFFFNFSQENRAF
jgi:hypothetical protein